MTAGDPLSAVLVEDEPLALAALRELVAEVPWLANVGEAQSGAQAVALIDGQRPDLVFLDVQLPEITGLQVLERVDHTPAVIFTTAYDRYAVAAFELQALDYLIKPFGRDRFQRAVERARQALGAEAPAALERARTALCSERPRRLLVRDRGRIVPVDVASIERLEADGDYVTVHSAGHRYLVGLPLSAFVRRLDPARFVRVHRSHIVNLDHMRALEPFDGARFQIIMRDGTRILASRARSKELRGLII